jgi:hypothetical protein
VFVSNLAASVGSARSVKAQIAAMETFTAVAPRLQDFSLASLRAWINCLSSCTQDKHKEVRRASEEALAAVHALMEHAELQEVQGSIDGAETNRSFQVFPALSPGVSPMSAGM